MTSTLKWCILVLQNNVDDAQEAFDAFFAHYPYCYGYWKKYADILKKNGDVEKAIEVGRIIHFFLKILFLFKLERSGRWNNSKD